MKILLVMLVCGAADLQCHHERFGIFKSFEACARAAGYDNPPKRHPQFKCVVQ